MAKTHSEFKSGITRIKPLPRSKQSVLTVRQYRLGHLTIWARQEITLVGRPSDTKKNKAYHAKFLAAYLSCRMILMNALRKKPMMRKSKLPAWKEQVTNRKAPDDLTSNIKTIHVANCRSFRATSLVDGYNTELIVIYIGNILRDDRFVYSDIFHILRGSWTFSIRTSIVEDACEINIDITKRRVFAGCRLSLLKGLVLEIEFGGCHINIFWSTRGGGQTATNA